jgi:hypothetical protein
MLAFFLFGIWGLFSIKFEKKIFYEDLDTALKQKATQGYLDQHILDALRDDRFNDAVMYQYLAEYLGVQLDSYTLHAIDEQSDVLSQSWRNIKSFGKGFFSGNADDMVGLTGAITSDMTLYGDLRDLSKEGIKFVQGQSYDKLIFGMAAIGVGLSASQLFSFGSTTPIKVGASVVKAAKKAGKLSKSFIRIATSKLSKAIDFKVLKKVDYSSPSAIKKETKRIAKSLNTPYLKKVFRNIDTIHKNTDSYADTIALLKYVDDPKDLQRVANISKKYKKNTKAVFKVLGKKVIKGIVKGTSRIIKWTSLLIAQVISLIISIIMGIVTFFTKWLSWRKVKQKFHKKSVATKNTVFKKAAVILKGETTKLSDITLWHHTEAIIGRGMDTDINIKNSYLSGKHVKLTYIDDVCIVAEDLGSTNGTYINGRKLTPYVPTVLKKGERLIVGSEDVVYVF